MTKIIVLQPERLDQFELCARQLALYSDDPASVEIAQTTLAMIELLRKQMAAK